MSNRKSERRQAIEADLMELTPTVEEDIIEMTAQAVAEESNAIQEEREFQQRVNAIYMRNKQLGITPIAWFCAQRWTTLENCLIRDALTERWETEEMSDSYDDDEDDYYRHFNDPDAETCDSNLTAMPLSWVDGL